MRCARHHAASSGEAPPAARNNTSMLRKVCSVGSAMVPKKKVQFAARVRRAFYRCPELDETALGGEFLVHTVSWG